MSLSPDIGGYACKTLAFITSLSDNVISRVRDVAYCMARTAELNFLKGTDNESEPVQAGLVETLLPEPEADW